MPRLLRDPITWLIYAQLALWGYFNYGFGPIVPLLRDEEHTSSGVASLHSTAIAAGAMIGGATFPVLARRWGRGNVMWAAVAAIALCTVGFVALPARLPLTLSLAAIIAVFGILLVSGVVSALSEHHGPAGPAALSEANAAACAAGLVAPLVIGATVNAGWGWRPGLAVLIALVVIVAVIAFTRGVRVPSGSVAPATAKGVTRGALPRAYWIAWTMMAVTGSVEVGLSMWTVDVLRTNVGMASGSAAALISAILAGMFIGRLFGARLTLRLPVIPLYLAALATSAVGFAIFWTAGSPVQAGAGLVVLGLGNALHYPLVIALAVQVSPGQADRAAAASAYSMGLSFGAGPLVLGLIADRVGAHAAFLLVPLLLLLAGFLAWRLSLALRPAAPDSSAAGAASAAELLAEAPIIESLTPAVASSASSSGSVRG
ncbi:MFS family permease [Allocatelliglobosispora scoriae]|uniref:MFS family permease n=1 Tax=Allocatelliglobosispora scoriae TaxID=643052 RepID=A0A841BXG7_9ACTN|nr:MFS transporter [Allocatelliglobosispora scoriae]MBB5871623.1 MFS family permease [Allocatelliglobosispora scoriae]